jgi:hypothetical protein
MLRIRAWGLRLAVVGGLAAAMTPAAPGSALAACSSSTPAFRSFADDPFDGDLGLAPEMTAVEATLGTTCDLVILPRLGDRSETAGLIRGETVATYVDTDGNAGTGSPLWRGADKVVLVVGRKGADLPPALGTWTGTQFSFAGGVTLPVVGAAGFAANLDQLGAPGPTTLGIRVVSSWRGLRDTYLDFAPESARRSFAFGLSFTTVATELPPGAPPPAPAPAGGGGFPRARCMVPKLRNLRALEARQRLASVGCRSRVVRVGSRLRPGRVVSTSPPAGARTSRTVIVRVALTRRR